MLLTAGAVLLGGVVLAGVGLRASGSGERSPVVRAVPEPGSNAPAATAEGRRPLLSARGFSSALRRAAASSPGGRLKLVRLAPERMDAQFARRDGGLDLVQVMADGTRRVIRTPAGGSGGTAPLNVAAIDRRAPGRLVRAAAERLHRKPGAVDYLVLLNITGGPRWSVYFKGGRAFLADTHGRITQRIS